MKSFLTILLFIAFISALTFFAYKLFVNPPLAKSAIEHTKDISNKVFIEYTNDCKRQLNITENDTLMNNYRIWQIPGSGNRIIDITFSKDTFNISLYKYWEHFEGEKMNILVIDSFNFRRKKIRFTRNELSDTLKALGIETLIDQKEIPGFKYSISDGISFLFEIKIKGNSKFVAYTSPFYFHDPDNQKACRILSFFSANIYELVI